MFSLSPSRPGRMRADPAHDDVHRHPGLRRPVERVDHLLVDQRVDLDPDAGVLALPVRLDLVLDAPHDPAPHAVGRHEQAPVRGLARVAGERVEQVGEVRADRRVGGEHPDVLVQPRGLRVVVAGADVAVAADRRCPPGAPRARSCSASSAPPARRRRARPRFSSSRAQRMLACSSNRALISTSATTCLPAAAASIERVDDGGVAGGAVERLLDRQHVRVGRGLLDEALHARGERVVGVVHQHVALAQRGEDALRRSRRSANAGCGGRARTARP